MPNHITNIVTQNGNEKRIKEMLESIKNDEYELIEVCGVKALFDNGRISDSDYPKDMYKYEMRMSDDDEIFCTIENSVAVNFGGTVLTKEPIDLGEKGYVSFTSETSPNFMGVHCTMHDFLNDNIEKGEVMDLC